MSVAGEIVDSHGSQLERFVANNRQQQSLNTQDYMDKFIVLDGLTARHRLNNGFESLDLQVQPFGGGSVNATATDTNLDGYMIWVHGEPGYGSTINGRPVKCGPFSIVINGYKIEDSYDPIMAGGHTGGYVFAFGKTALVSPSLAQDLDGANPLIGDTSFKRPLPLVPDPGWGDDLGNGLDGGLLNKKARRLGYWVFDWLNAYNPAQYLNRKPIFNLFDQYLKWSDFFTFRGELLGNLTLTKGIYFRSTSKSLLRPRGLNGMQVFSLSPYTPADQVVDLWFGEFYDRGKYRIVRQSWQVAPKPRQAVKVNDYPNRYLTTTIQNVEGNYHGYTANFDLSAVFSKDTRNNLNNGPTNNHMSTLGGAATDVSLTPTQQAILDAWRTANVLIYRNFAATQTTTLIQLLKAVTDLNPAVAEAHKLAFLVRAYVGDYTLYSGVDTFPNDAQWYTPVGSTIPLTHGTPRPPLIQPFSSSQTITTTWASTPGHPGSYFSTGVTVSNSGPTQDYWIDVTPDQNLAAYRSNATTLATTGISARYSQTGVLSDVTTGTQAGGTTTETITYSYTDTPAPTDGAPDKIVGPAHDAKLALILCQPPSYRAKSR